MRTLVLWDVDHTLLDSGGVSRGVYARAFERVTGRPMLRMAAMAGRTEWAIMTETLDLHDVPVTEGLLEAYGKVLAAEFSAAAPEARERGRALPGAREALAALSARTDVVQSVLTGNIEPIAIEKLTIFDLTEYVDLSVGAYGLDHNDRAELVRLARERAARAYGEPFTPARTVLVGDTPLDVQAGHDSGARVVAVATGSSDHETLVRAGADTVLNDLTDLDATLHAILPG